MLVNCVGIGRYSVLSTPTGYSTVCALQVYRVQASSANHPPVSTTSTPTMIPVMIPETLCCPITCAIADQ